MLARKFAVVSLRLCGSRAGYCGMGARGGERNRIAGDCPTPRRQSRCGAAPSFKVHAAPSFEVHAAPSFKVHAASVLRCMHLKTRCCK